MKVLWIDAKIGAIPYECGQHLHKAHNFVCWFRNNDGRLLLIGSGRFGRDERNTARDGSHHSLVACAQDLGVEVPTRVPDGAGGVADENVWSWQSFGFEVTTPETLKPHVLAVLGLSNTEQRKERT